MKYARCTHKNTGEIRYAQILNYQDSRSNIVYMAFDSIFLQLSKLEYDIETLDIDETQYRLLIS